MLICDTLNLVGVKPYDRKLYEKEMENSMKKRLLGLDRQATQSFKPSVGNKLLNNPTLHGSGRGEGSLHGSSIEKSASPTKANGMYIYSQEKVVNQVLNAVSNFEARQNANVLKDVAGFKANAIGGVFSSPQGTSVSPAAMAGLSGLDSSSQLTEDELSIISDFEEESLRLGNYERIFPLQQNCVHY